MKAILLFLAFAIFFIGTSPAAADGPQQPASDPSGIPSLYYYNIFDNQWHYLDQALDSCYGSCLLATAFNYYTFSSGVTYMVVGQHSVPSAIPPVVYSYHTWTAP